MIVLGPRIKLIEVDAAIRGFSDTEGMRMRASKRDFG